MASKKIILQNSSNEQLLPMSKAQLIELSNALKSQNLFGGAIDVDSALSYLSNYIATSYSALETKHNADHESISNWINNLEADDITYIAAQEGVERVTVEDAITELYSILAGLSGEGTGSVQDQINSAINNLNAGPFSETDKPIISVGQTNGLISGTPGTISSQYVTVANTNNQYGSDNDTVEEVLSYLLTLANNNKVSVTRSTSNTAYAAQYTIADTTGTLGIIDIPKDLVATQGTLVYGSYSESSGWTENASGDPYIQMTIANGNPFYINVANLIEYNSVDDTDEIILSDTNHVITATIDKVNATKIAYTYTGGTERNLKDIIGDLYNITNSIKGSVDALDASYTISSGQIISYVGQSDGLISVETTRLNDDMVYVTSTVSGLYQENDTHDVKTAIERLKEIADSAKINTITITDGTYIKATNESFNNNTLAFTIDDSFLANMSGVTYTAYNFGENLSDAFITGQTN